MIAFAQEHFYGGRYGAPLALTAYTRSEAKKGYRYSCMRVPSNDDLAIPTSMHTPLVPLIQQLLPAGYMFATGSSLRYKYYQ